MVTERLKKITQEEFDNALQNHFLYQKGGEDNKRMILQNRDFSGIKIMKTDLSFVDFENSDFSNLYDYNSGFSGRQLYDTILTGANCRGVNFGKIDLSKVSSMKNTVLINAIFDSRMLSEKQKSEAIFTEEQYKDYLERQNERVKKQEVVIKNQTEVIQKKDETIKKTSKEESKGMLEIFDELRIDFFREEILWMIFSLFLFATIFAIFETVIASVNSSIAFIIFLIPFLGLMIVVLLLSFTRGKDSKSVYSWKDVGIGTIIVFIGLAIVSGIQLSIASWTKIVCTSSVILNNCLTIENTGKIILPIVFLLLSFLWFSVHQYGRAKKLRTEQQNKQAMIHFMQAIIANDGLLSKENQSFPQLAPFFANAIIHRPFSQENYDPQLPIDEVKKVIDMAKLFQK